ncbi:MAG: helix-turn-helix domain-containing protein [Spirochaetota bacterium]|nr:helix-turn-helix domain-containing protein [Spirochaetota bacterium]
MEYPKISLGQYLKNEREQRGLSIDEAAIETNIAKKYIEALEKDEYGFFPAEMYVIGFLSSYIEMLELDKELVLSMYKRAISKEQEAPLEVFYNLHSTTQNTKKYIKWLVLGIPIVLIFFVILVFHTKSISSSQKNNNTQISDYNTRQNSTIINISLIELAQNNQFSIGVKDTIVLMDEEQEIAKIEFFGIVQKNKKIKFHIKQNQYIYKKGDVLHTDISGNGVNDLSLEIISITDKKIELVINFKKDVIQTTFFDTTPYINSIRNTVPLAVVNNKAIFNVTITATRSIWVGYQADTVEEQQKILNVGESVKFSFIDGAKVSLGNAGAAVITFSEFTNVIRGGAIGESSQSIFYKKTSGADTTLYRAQLK